MTRQVFLILASLTTLFSSCQRQISADFIFNKTEYVGGDTIKLTNKSIDALTYKWSLPNGAESSAENLDYPIDINQTDGSLTFKLEAFSKKGKKKDDISKTTLVKAKPQPQPLPDTTKVTFDGYTYSIIYFSNGQAWMGENLRTDVYANGDTIPNVTDYTEWQNLTTGAWAYYENNSQYDNPLGKLYNWYTLSDPRKVCPTGWHVPSSDDWTSLINHLGGDSIAGGKMKSVDSSYWLSPNTAATNESGFSGLPGGTRLSNGTFNSIGLNGNWWSTKTYGPSFTAKRLLENTSGEITNSINPIRNGNSVRCLKD